MTSDEWQAHVTHAAARAVGQWLEARGRLHQPIASLTMADLEAMASNAIGCFVVMGSQLIAAKEDAGGDLSRLLLG